MNSNSLNTFGKGVLSDEVVKYKKLHETMMDAFVSINMDGTLVEWNSSYKNLLGYSDDELSKLNYKDITPAKWYEFEDKIVREQVMKEGYSEVYEKEYIKKDGTIIPIELRTFLLRDDSGTPLGMWGIIRDISERKKILIESLKNEERLRILAEILSHDSKTIQEFLDYALEKALLLTSSKLGYIYHYNEASEEFVLNTWSKEVMAECSVINPKSLYELSKTGIWGEAVRQRKPIILNDFEAYHPLKKGHPEGHATLYKFMTIPVFKGKEIIAVVGVANKDSDYNEMDVLQLTLLMDSVFKVVGRIKAEEDREKYEQLLKEKELVFQSFMEFSPIFVFFKDENIRAINLSRNFEQMLGMKLEDILGKTMDELFPSDLAKKMIEDDKLAIQNGKPIQINEEFNGKHYTTIKFPIIQKNKPPMLAGFTIDITEKKKIEETLQQSQKLESLGMLAGGIAHDFNNLLGGIFGYISLAANISNEEKVKDFLDKAMQAMSRAKGLTQQLLTFAKGGAPVRKIAHLFPFVQETVLFALSGANIFPKFNVADDLWLSDFDKNQIGQVVDNLVINAKQAMPLGGVVVVSAENCLIKEAGHSILPEGKYIKISFKDNGIGIPKEIIGRIFDPFFTTKQAGSGLGLSTCYSIIKKHGGIIDVESEPGNGSSFTIYLPAAEKIEEIENSIHFSAHNGSGEILIMDDEDAILDFLTHLLFSLGYSVVSAKDGNEAVQIFKEKMNSGEKFKAIMLDLTVPGKMGGEETIKEIRKIDTTTPAFVSSGYAEDPVIANPEDYGFTASISKPFLVSELTELFNKHLKK